MNESSSPSCACPCHGCQKKMPGVFLLLFGLTFLLKNLGVYDDHLNNIIWPSLLIVGGLGKVFSGMCKCCKGGSKCA